MYQAEVCLQADYKECSNAFCLCISQKSTPRMWLESEPVRVQVPVDLDCQVVHHTVHRERAGARPRVSTPETGSRDATQ